MLGLHRILSDVRNRLAGDDTSVDALCERLTFLRLFRTFGDSFQQPFTGGKK